MWRIWFSRCCTHLDIGDEELEAAIEAATKLTVGAVER